MSNMTIAVMMVYLTCHEVVLLYDIFELFLWPGVGLTGLFVLFWNFSTLFSAVIYSKQFLNTHTNYLEINQIWKPQGEAPDNNLAAPWKACWNPPHESCRNLLLSLLIRHYSPLKFSTLVDRHMKHSHNIWRRYLYKKSKSHFTHWLFTTYPYILLC